MTPIIPKATIINRFDHAIEHQLLPTRSSTKVGKWARYSDLAQKSQFHREPNDSLVLYWQHIGSSLRLQPIDFRSREIIKAFDKVEITVPLTVLNNEVDSSSHPNLNHLWKHHACIPIVMLHPVDHALPLRMHYSTKQVSATTSTGELGTSNCFSRHLMRATSHWLSG